MIVKSILRGCLLAGIFLLWAVNVFAQPGPGFDKRTFQSKEFTDTTNTGLRVATALELSSGRLLVGGHKWLNKEAFPYVAIFNPASYALEEVDISQLGRKGSVAAIVAVNANEYAFFINYSTYNTKFKGYSVVVYNVATQSYLYDTFTPSEYFVHLASIKQAGDSVLLAFQFIHSEFGGSFYSDGLGIEVLDKNLQRLSYTQLFGDNAQQLASINDIFTFKDSLVFIHEDGKRDAFVVFKESPASTVGGRFEYLPFDPNSSSQGRVGYYSYNLSNVQKFSNNYFSSYTDIRNYTRNTFISDTVSFGMYVFNENLDSLSTVNLSREYGYKMSYHNASDALYSNKICIGGSLNENLNPWVATTPAKPLIAMLTGTGNVTWKRVLEGLPEYHVLNRVVATKNGGCVFYGYKWHKELTEAKRVPFFVVTDSTGNVVTGINDLPAPQHTLAYPNPATELVNITWEPLTWGTTFTVSLNDIQGKTVYAAQANPTQNNLQINLTNLPKGLYAVQVKALNGTVQFYSTLMVE